jgi:enoyl-CoA hydratase/carnithine racemase
VKVMRDGPVRTLTLDRPGKLNAMDAAQWRALHTALREAEADEETRVVVLRGEGRAFCAGNDIAAMAACRQRAEARAYFVDTMLPAFEAMATSPLPIVARVDGLALGGGAELVLFCDLAVAASTAAFELPETRVGVWATVFLGAAPYAGVQRLARTLALTGSRLSAADANAAGLVTHVAEPQDVDGTVRRVAEEITRGGRHAVASSKRFANRALVHDGLPAVRAALEELVEHTLFGEEYERGVGAFLSRTERKASHD